jgi:hypothetical protein
MTLSDLASVGSLVSGLAVTASLIYLALQTHQNAKHTKALLNQGQSNRVVTTLLSFATPEMAETWIEGNGGAATPAAMKELRFAQLCNAMIYDMLDFHNQNIDGLISKEMFGTTEVAYAVFLQQPGLRAYWASWRATRQHKAPKFIAWVDSLATMPEQQVSANWN